MPPTPHTDHDIKLLIRRKYFLDDNVASLIVKSAKKPVQPVPCRTTQATSAEKMCLESVGIQQKSRIPTFFRYCQAVKGSLVA